MSALVVVSIAMTPIVHMPMMALIADHVLETVLCTQEWEWACFETKCDLGNLEYAVGHVWGWKRLASLFSVVVPLLTVHFPQLQARSNFNDRNAKHSSLYIIFVL